MFTGIIQNLGIIKKVEKSAKQVRLTIQFQKKQNRVQQGESIALNGVCLTATKINPMGFEADLLPETVEITTLGNLKPGDLVNLERALKQGDSLGGHLVSGHVDSVGKVNVIGRRGGNWSLLVHAPKAIISKLRSKGSVAIDGVSLTVQALTRTHFQVAVIPHTLAVTTLHFLKVGSRVNLEVDHSLELMHGLKQVEKSHKLKIKNLIRQGF